MIVVIAGCASGRLDSHLRNARIQEGDILFQSLDGEICSLIEGVTQSPYSHCGIVVKSGSGGLAVLEAIGGGARETPLMQWLRRSDGLRFAVYRLRQDNRACIPELIKACRKHIGKPYDIRYRMDDDFIYCSELIFKGYKEVTGGKLGTPVKLGSLNWKPYSEQIERIEGGPVPLERLMITPADLARAKQLKLHYSSY